VLRIITTTLYLALLVAACGRSAPPATPTAIPVATFTSTPVPPTPIPASSTPEPPTAAPSVVMPSVEDVLGALQDAGIQLVNVEINPPIEQDSPLPRSFREHARFADLLLGDKGGQIFVCDDPRHCMALQAYFDALIALAGPYTFTSPSGLVVAQLNSGFTPDQAERYRAVLAGF